MEENMKLQTGGQTFSGRQCSTDCWKSLDWCLYRCDECPLAEDDRGCQRRIAMRKTNDKKTPRITPGPGGTAGSGAARHDCPHERENNAERTATDGGRRWPSTGIRIAIGMIKTRSTTIPDAVIGGAQPGERIGTPASGFGMKGQN